MWQRYELKERAKGVIRKYYWGVVIVCLISGIFSGEYQFHISRSRYNIGKSSNMLNSVRDTIDWARNGLIGVSSAGIYTAFAMIVIVLLIIGVLVSIFVGYPILIGSKRFFMKSREEKTSVGTVFYAFKSGHMLNVILIIFVQKVKIFLWSLLLVVPGIIKSYEYRMIPYILSENPEIEHIRAFELSREMMTGQKWDTFVLDLSFILWGLLGAVTCGLGSILFVNPYKAATNAELYAVLRTHILSNGVSNTYELPGFFK